MTPMMNILIILGFALAFRWGYIVGKNKCDADHKKRLYNRAE